MPIPRRTSVRAQGRTLFLTEDAELLKKQLAGGSIAFDPERQRSSTTSRPTSSRPAGFATTTTRRSRATAWSACAAARSSKDAIKNGGFGVIVSGVSKGCGSSRARRRRTASSRRACSSSSRRASRRSTARTARTSASSRRPTSASSSASSAARRSRSTSSRKGLDPISAAIVEHGGLFAYNRRASRARSSPPRDHDAPRAR